MVDLICGDACEVLSKFTSESIDCVISSPPYFKQRDYGIQGQIGREASVSLYVQQLAAVSDELFRVLKPFGTFWLNLDDKYISGELCGIPWLVWFELKSRGWRTPAEVIWNKSNAMPDSGARRRPGRSHETVFMFTKQVGHYYDYEAIVEPAAWHRWGKQTTKKRNPGKLSWIRDRPKEELTQRTTKRKRSVWSVPTGNYKGAHYAVFPNKLVAPMILASCPVGGVVLDPFCGSGVAVEEAVKNGRNAIGIDLDPKSIALSRERLGLEEAAVA